jgi:hypothetical protein
MARRRIDRGLLVASLAIAAGLAIIGWGLSGAITGSRGVNLPEAIESVNPTPNAVQVLSQSNIFVDLENGYFGVLVVNGVELETISLDQIGSLEVEPGRQVDIPPVTIFEPGNSTLTFSPSRGAAVERLSTGLQEVTVIFWRLDEGRQRASSFTWKFNVV